MNRRQFILTSGASLILPSFSYAGNGDWPVIREWDKNEFNKYSKWVENVYDVKRNGSGKQKTAKFDRLILDDEMNLLNQKSFLESGNNQVSESDAKLFRALCHCGSFPELMFSYFSYRRGLPGVVSKIKPRKGGDIRYSLGNHPVAHIDSVSFDGTFRDYLQNTITGSDNEYNFVSGNFRTAPDLEGTESVPISLDRNFLKPGSICYNANGHVLVVGKIDDSGEVHFLDSHPDHSITFNQSLSAIPRIKENEDGVRGFERCYDGFRNPRLVKIENGKGVYFSNEEMIEYGFSIEQYKLMKKINDGLLEEKSFPSLVKNRLRTKRENPLEFLERSTDELKEMFLEREQFVQEAWKEVLRNGPITFPNESNSENIYQANGRWETWSSPSSDIDRRNKYHYILTTLEDAIDDFPSSERYVYDTGNKVELIQEIHSRKNSLFNEAGINYVSSNGNVYHLSLSEIEKRLYNLSFDPNHAPELRWGAPENSQEREGMVMLRTPLKSGGSLSTLESYDKEEILRFNLTRQSTPTSLNPGDNANRKQYQTIDEMLSGKLNLIKPNL